jgi:hypothetical protein
MGVGELVFGDREARRIERKGQRRAAKAALRRYSADQPIAVPAAGAPIGLARMINDLIAPMDKVNRLNTCRTHDRLLDRWHIVLNAYLTHSE